MTPIGKDITKHNEIACSSMSYTPFFYTYQHQCQSEFGLFEVIHERAHEKYGKSQKKVNTYHNHAEVPMCKGFEAG